MHLEPAVKKEPFCAPHREHLPEEWEVEASSAPPSEQPTAAETPAELEPPAAEIPAQPLEQPACVPLPTATVVEYIAAEVLEVVIEGPAADPAVPPPDAFGAGVEDPPRDPDKT
jgi:hypothetical protein